ncbi:MAG: carboxypeptidase-like regulatory domain-containing protein, partial [Candidatus Hydrogenedentes bacterium]|nr:carboxypeptidase-like regulatory domain-containing protein [Candidatus Hydrogenedentota bacterium]
MFSFALPPDEEIYVMSLSKQRSRQGIYRSKGGDEPGLAEAVWNAVQGEGILSAQEQGGDKDKARVLSFVRLGEDGTFELRVSEEIEVVHLALTGRYVFSNESTEFEVGGEQPIVVTGQLGAWITGKVRAPLGAADDVSMEGVSVSLAPDLTAGYSAREIQSVAYGVRASADASGSFEFRSVPIEYALSFLASSEDFGAQLRDGAEGMRLISGEHFNFEVRMEEGATLRGWVLDEFLNPVTGGLVEVQSPGTVGKVLGVLRETIIEEDGSFELKHVATGFRLNLLATPVGYQVGRHKLEDSLREGQLLDEILIEVTKGKSLRGIVKFADDSPAKKVKVVLLPDYAALDPALAGSIAAAFRASEAETNGEGEFELHGLAAGPFKVNVETLVEEGSLAGSWSGVLAGLEGDEQDVEIVLEKLSLIPGIVTTKSELPIGDLEVRLTLKDSGGVMGIGKESRVVDAGAPSEEGEFEVSKVRAGIWQVALKAEGFAWTETQDVKVPVAENVPVPQFFLVPSSSVSGVVYDNSGTTISGAVVTLNLDMAGLLDAANAGGAPSTHSDHEGKFRLEDVAPGVKSIHATLAGFAPSEALSLEFLAGEQVQDVSLTLRLGGTIAGEVFGPDGEPAEGRSIIFQNLPSLSSQVILESNRDGEFRAENLEPGKWQVVAMKNVMNGEIDVEGGEGMGDLLSGMLMDVVTVAD